VKKEEELETFTQELIAKLKTYQADGLDLDFENIDKSHLQEFSTLVEKLARELKKNDLRFVVTIQAQTAKSNWQGTAGQDLALIGREADEVRIMIYDQHGNFSDPGPITSTDWFQDVLDHNLKIIPREKITVALPTYGYIWEKDGGFKSLQHKDFLAYAESQKFDVTRDPASSELKFENENSTGFLSDASAIIPKMEYARSLGLNRFAIWNFSGTDETLFEKQWPTIEVSVPEEE
jgi:spore germination protein YaaH